MVHRWDTYVQAINLGRTKLLCADPDLVYSNNANIYPLNLEQDVLIHPESIWFTNDKMTLLWNYTNHNGGSLSGGGEGEWWDKDEFKYLGIKFYADNNPYYGWIRLNVNYSEHSITVADYAYNAQPSAAIFTGTKGGESIELKTAIERNNIIVFLPKYLLDVNTLIELYDISGKRIFSNVYNNNPQIYIPATTFSSGIYIVTATDGKVTRSGKVIFK